MFCPNCGTKNNPKSKFCKNCGYDLAKYKQQMSHPSHPKPAQHPRRQPVRMTRRPMQPMMPPKKRHTGCFVSLAIVAIFAMLIFGGVYTYSHNLFPFGNGPLSSLSKSPSDSNTGVIKDLWAKVNNKVNSASGNNGSADFADDFEGGANSHAYHTVEGWCNLQNDHNPSNDTKVKSITPSNFKNHGNGDYTYDVRYDFKIDAGSNDSYHNIQIFRWKTQMKNGKIVSMNSPKQPIKQFKE